MTPDRTGLRAGRSRITRFTVAVAAPTAATVLMRLTWPLFEQTPNSLYFAAIACAAWYGGLLPGLLSVAFSVVVADYLFVEPYFALWPLRAAGVVQLVALAGVGTGISVLSESTHRALRRAESNMESLRRTDESARESENRLRLAHQVARIGTFDWNIQTGVNTWTPELEAMYGLAPGGFAGTQQTWEGLVFEEDRAEAVRQVELAIKGKSFEAEWRVVWPDGTVRWLAGRALVFKDDAGRPLRLLGVNIDITERKQAETRLRAQLDRMSLLERITRATGEREDPASLFQVAVGALEGNMPLDFACICFHEPAAGILTVAAIGSRSLDLAGELGLADASSIPIDQNGLSACVQGRLIYEPDLSVGDAPFPRRLAGVGLGSLVIAPLAVKGAVFGVLVAARRATKSFGSQDCEFLHQLSDHVALAAHQVTLRGDLQTAYDELRRTQQKVLEQERLRALGQMAGGIAHDINNALTPIALYTNQLLETEANLSAEGRGSLEIIERAIQDIAQTIARLREFYRAGDEEQSLVQLNDLVLQVKELTRVRWHDMPQQRGIVIDVRTELDPDLPAVLGQGGDVRDALVNLVFNAVDALPEGGTIRIRTAADHEERFDEDGTGRNVVLEVIDSGTGMDDATKRQCLEPFFTTKGERGTGLGLAMVYGMTQRHGANLQIESESGKGTTVRLIFPVRDSVADSEHPSVARRLRQLRILIVDDDPVLLRALSDILRGDDHDVVAMSAGQKGIDAFASSLERGTPFELVITDLGIPHVDGRQVAAAIKALSPETPIVMLTGWGERLAASREPLQHVDRLLSKPPKLRELRTTIAELMD